MKLDLDTRIRNVRRSVTERLSLDARVRRVREEITHRKAERRGKYSGD